MEPALLEDHGPPGDNEEVHIPRAVIFVYHRLNPRETKLVWRV